jgi:amino acid adenylation domain-containing protein
MIDMNEFDPFAQMADAPLIEQALDSTEAQREIWLASTLSSQASLAYNEAVEIRFDGQLDVPALQRALDQLVICHQSLRATFSDDGLQFVVNAPAQVKLAQIEANSDAKVLQQHRHLAVTVPFDLSAGPLFRAKLIVATPTESSLILSAHHIVCDGWSFGVLVPQLAKLYSAAVQNQPMPALDNQQYSQYIQEELSYQKSSEFSQSRAWWISQYDKTSPVLDLPLDQPRPATRGFESNRLDRLLAPSLATQLTEFARREGTTLFNLLLAGFSGLMQRMTGQDEVVIGVPAAGQAAVGMSQLVGHCVNTLPIRLSNAQDQTISQYLKSSQSQLLDAFENQRVTFGTLLKSLQLKRDPSRPTLTGLMFNLDQELEPAQFPFFGLTAQIASVPRAYENMELFLNVVPTAAGLRLEAQYNSAIFSAATVDNWLQSFEALLADLTSQVNSTSRSFARLSLATAQQQQRLAAWSQRSDPEFELQQLDTILRKHFLAYPDDLAVVAGRARLSYGELQSRSAQLAHLMQQRGVGPGQLVGVCLPRNADMIVAVYAVLMLGAAYVPLDPNFPPARLAYMVQDSKLTLVVSDTVRIAVLPTDAPKILLDADLALLARQSTTQVVVQAKDSDAAYVLYTSGSTGQPKGVAVPRSGLKNILLGMALQTGLARHDRLLAVTTLSFDISLIEVFMPLVCGATVVVATRDQVVDGKALMDLIEQEQITFLQATPSGWRVLFEAGWVGGRPGFKGLVGGESLAPELALRMVRACSAVWNGYGPTETSIYSTCWKVEGLLNTPPTQISIGTPVANTTIDIRDGDGKICAIGQRGELCIAGAGLAIGYLNREQLTAEKFVVGADGQRYYRTGDLARWRSDGLIEHLGRMDSQVKLRGYRIELGEIEAALVKQPAIADAVAIVREDVKNEQRLVAYVIAKANQVIDEAAVREALKIDLPRYMLPAHIVVLDQIPRLPNTKVNRAALPAPAVQVAAVIGVDDSLNTLLPSDKAKKLAADLAKMMGKILGAVDVGLQQDFFALGGHSLTAAQFATRANRLLAEQLPAPVSLKHIFEAPTPALLTALLLSLERKNRNQDVPLRARADRSKAPLSLVQQRLWDLEQLTPGRALYNTPSAHRLRGRINLNALQAAIEAVVQRQDVLRTVVELEDGKPIQRILPSVSFSILQVHDLSSVADDLRAKHLHAQMQELIDTPISMTQAPLFVVRLYKLAPEEHVLFFMTHHFIWDGWSFDLFYEEVATAYVYQLDKKTQTLPALEITYGDYSLWQAQWLKTPAYQQQISFWREKLSRNHEITPLKTDFARRASMSGRGATEWITLQRDTIESLRSVAKSADTTLFTVLLACFSVLLRTLGSSERQSIGIPVRGRNSPETEPVMGYFTNLLPLILRQEPAGSFVDLVRSAKSELVAAYAAPDVPMEELTSALTGSARNQPLYLALFSFQDVRNRPVDWGNLRHERVEVAQRGATEDFGLWFVENDTALVGGLTYNTDLYRTETARTLHKRLLEIMAQAGRNSNQPLEHLLAPYLSSNDPSVNQSWQNSSAPTAPAIAKDPPTTDAEKALASIWAELLQIQGIERTDNFFDLGGNSLLAMQAVRAAGQHFSVQLDPRRYLLESLAVLAQGYQSALQAANAPAIQKKGLIGRLFGGGRGSG